ncbi:MAG: dihydropteroate synthase [Bacteroidetes bacterium]|nr:dihydropteroate synthase [Bacteroidota bacterium]
MEHIEKITSPQIMGILNATPDSFYTKGNGYSAKDLLSKAIQMVMEGATILDIGGMSTRPGAIEISKDEELARVIPVIKLLAKELPSIQISVDTYRSQVALEAIHNGASIINDISGAQFDEAILIIAANNRARYICMHTQNKPNNMQLNPSYKDVVNDLLLYFEERIALCHQKGLHDVILDVGFGFGKTIDHNFRLLAQMHQFTQFGLPILAGISRKSMVSKVVGSNTANALNGTTALHMIALQQGANILRVHDVKEAKECIMLFEKLKENTN